MAMLSLRLINFDLLTVREDSVNLLKVILHFPLKFGPVFDLQQRLCNDYRTVVVQFKKYLDIPGQQIIDIGCSTGEAARSIINMKENSYIGIDIEPKYVEIAQKKSPNGKFFAQDARKLNFTDSQFDIGMFIGVLHHMDDQLARDCLREASRVVGSKGIILVAEPIFTKTMPLSTFLLKLDRGGHIRTPEQYENLFGDCKVKNRNIFRFSRHMFVAYMLQPN